MSNEASQTTNNILTPEEKQRLISFLEVLIQIDQREHITTMAKSKCKRKEIQMKKKPCENCKCEKD